MEIKLNLPYNVGDMVYVLEYGKIQKGEISKITLTYCDKNAEPIIAFYVFYGGNTHTLYCSDKFSKNKTDLIEDLIKQNDLTKENEE